jgi:pseudouridine-5'-phosphate glycosidase
VRGGAVTPFVLARLHSLSSGATEEANKQLVYSNVRLASRVAAHL